jgi:hypothetical protein
MNAPNLQLYITSEIPTKPLEAINNICLFFLPDQATLVIEETESYWGIEVLYDNERLFYKLYDSDLGWINILREFQGELFRLLFFYKNEQPFRISKHPMIKKIINDIFKDAIKYRLESTVEY